MSIFQVTTRIDRRWLLRKSKDDLVSIILANIDRIDLFADAKLCPHNNVVGYCAACDALTYEVKHGS